MSNTRIAIYCEYARGLLGEGERLVKLRGYDEECEPRTYLAVVPVEACRRVAGKGTRAVEVRLIEEVAGFLTVQLPRGVVAIVGKHQVCGLPLWELEPAE